MSDSQSLNTRLLEVMISSKDEGVFIHDLNDLTLPIIFDAWWGSMNVGKKHAIAWKNCRHAPSWRFNLHCRIDETGSPGIICIVCHQVLSHLSEHGTSSMVDEAALAILKRQGSSGNTVESSLEKYIGDIDDIDF